MDLNEIVERGIRAFQAARDNGELVELGMPERGCIYAQGALLRADLVWEGRGAAIYRGQFCYYIVADVEGLCGTSFYGC